MTAPANDAATGEGLLTLADVAALAQVRRPVVSMWRRRPCAAGPFPGPVAMTDGIERFDRAEVVKWLVASGRGNNRRVGDDAALYVRPPLPTPGGFDLAAALLAVRALTGEQLAGTDRDDLLDLADEADPEDRAVFTELAAADLGDLRAVAAYADALADASYGPADALAHLRRDPSRFRMAPDPSAPSAEVARLVGALAVALAQPLREQGPCPLADPTGCSVDLVLAASRADGEEWRGGVLARPATSADTEGGSAAIRHGWRTLAAHIGLPGAIDVDAEGHIDVAGPAVVLARYPHPGAPALAPAGLLDEIDDVLVQLKPEQRAVVLGPASALTDALGGARARDRRRRILDTGRLRALVRLDRRSAPAAPQRRLALWVFGPVPRADFRAEGRTAVADLAGLDLGSVTDDLVADVVAALEDRALDASGQRAVDETEGRAHAFRVARYQPTFSVLARQGDLVPRDLRGARRAPVRLEDGAARVTAALTLIDRLATPAHAPGVHVRAGDPDAPLPRGRVTTIRELLQTRRLRVLPGIRLVRDEAPRSDGNPAGVPVVGVPELAGEAPMGARMLDLLAFTARHPRAGRTEAGDVVFCAGPRPAAWVDVRGGAVVEAPARVLRILPADDARDRLIPRVLAADLERGQGSQWRACPARLVPVGAAGTLAEVLDAVALARDDALARARDLARLADTVTDGTVDGHLATMMEPTHDEGN